MKLPKEKAYFEGYYIASCGIHLTSTLTCSRNLKMEEVNELFEDLRVTEVSKLS